MQTVDEQIAVESQSPRRIPKSLLFFLMFAWLALVVRILSAPSLWHPDIWWQMDAGRQLLATGHFPLHDVHSFTAHGDPWINHEWLSGLLFYLSLSWFGWVGLYCCALIVQQLLAFGTFLLAYTSSKNAAAAFVFACLGVLLSTVNYGARPILFGWVCLIAIIWLLLRFRRQPDRFVWFIPAVFALWINLHGSWPVGIIVFAIVFAFGWISEAYPTAGFQPWRREQRRTLPGVFFASIAALFINPYGYHLVIYPFQFIFKQPDVQTTILEWASVDFHQGRGKVVFVMLAIALISFAVSRIRPTLEELALVLFGLYAGLTHIRLVILMVILLAPIVTKRMNFIPRFRGTWNHRYYYLALTFVLLAIVGLSIPPAQQIQAETLSMAPKGAMAFLKSESPGARVFDYWEWGGYEIWTHGPATFVDTRTDLFEYNGTLKAYLEAYEIRRPLEVLDEYRIDYVLFPPEKKLSYVLAHNSKWQVVYQDPVSVVFARSITR